MMRIKGFTLLEVIVAIAISAVALIGIAGMIGESHNRTGHLEKKIAADLAAQNLMDRHRYTFNTGNRYPVKEETDSVKMGGLTFPYTQNVTDANLPGLKKVNITVYDTDNESVLRKLTMYAGE
jgi:general secretion pathway protein I